MGSEGEVGGPIRAWEPERERRKRGERKKEVVLVLLFWFVFQVETWIQQGSTLTPFLSFPFLTDESGCDSLTLESMFPGKNGASIKKFKKAIRLGALLFLQKSLFDAVIECRLQYKFLLFYVLGSFVSVVKLFTSRLIIS